jgi:cyclohexanone monooxygenase
MLDVKSGQNLADKTDFDMLIVGAGFGGIRMLHEARTLGMSARILEAAPDVGGTWYFNRYPGARTDTEAWGYCFFFDKDLLRDYEWKERLPTWRQVADYFAHVVERFDMRKDITFSSRVKGATYDQDRHLWKLTTEDGRNYTSRYLVTATGVLTIAYDPPFKGVKNFKGQVLVTSNWPSDSVSFAGKRVAIVGAGSTAVQILPIIAHSAEHVTLFQRTANYVLPNRNHPVGKEQLEEIRRTYDQVIEKCNNQVFAFPMNNAGRIFSDVTREQAQAILEKGWEAGGFRYLFETFDDILVDQEANDFASEFVRQKIRAIVNDPDLAELLCPDHPIGVKRPPNGNFYYETFNRNNVSLVSVKKEPIIEFTETGIQTSERHMEFDIVVFALGFDAATGAYSRMDIRGENGIELKDHWREGPRTNLGICIDGFPNMFMISGPQSPFANIPVCVEHEVQWIGGALRTAISAKNNTIRTTPEAVKKWGDHLTTIFNYTLLPKGIDAGSWAVGANIPGKHPSVLFYFGGANNYFLELSAVVSEGYPGFLFQQRTQLRATVDS